MAIFTINNMGGAVDFETREYYARTLQNAKNLLRLRLGEVPYNRKAGLDSQLDHMAHGDLKRIITAEVERVMAFEPDVRVKAVRVMPAKAGEIYIEADIAIEEA